MFRSRVADGVELKQFELEDAAAVLAAVERNREYLRQWLPWVDQTRSEEDVGRFIERVREQLEAGRGPNLGIWLDGAFVGSIGCHPFDLANRNCSLGYWIEAGHQGKGAITRSCLKLLDYLFDEAGSHRVEIRCGIGNRRSSAIPQRLGFTQEGVLREAEWVNDRWVDLEVWAMLERDWRQIRP
jgi:ribosomal-protein-serine acetyltransferase